MASDLPRAVAVNDTCIDRLHKIMEAYGVVR
jgi:hypothetical protein